MSALLKYSYRFHGPRGFNLVCLVPLLLVLLSVGCSSYDRQYGLKDLDSRDPVVRIMAIKGVGESKDVEAVPRLVDFLQDEDPVVRLYSINALKRITGTDHGYDYKAGPVARLEAVKQWRRVVDPNELPD